MGHVPQGRQVFPDLTVEENIRLGAYTLRRRDKSRYAPSLATVWERFPKLYERRRQAGGHDVGRRAGRAGRGPGAGERAVDPSRRRAVGRPRSADRGRRVSRRCARSPRPASRCCSSSRTWPPHCNWSTRSRSCRPARSRGRGPVGELDRSMLAARLGIGRLLSAGTTKALKKRTAAARKRRRRRRPRRSKKKAAPVKKKAASRRRRRRRRNETRVRRHGRTRCCSAASRRRMRSQRINARKARRTSASVRGSRRSSTMSGVSPSAASVALRRTRARKHAPVIFVHGNNVDHADWYVVRDDFRAAGWTDQELLRPVLQRPRDERRRRHAARTGKVGRAPRDGQRRRQPA